jgi:glycosyltransferase involved in cell wall biosynthesis
MKVLYYALTFYPVNSGYSNAFQNLLNSLNDTDLDIDIVTPVPLSDSKELEISSNMTIHRIPGIESKRFRGFINQKKISNFITELDKKNNYDFILFETFEHVYVLSLLPKYIFNKLAIRIHGCLETETFVFSNKLTHRLRYFTAKKFLFPKLRYIISTNSYHNYFIKKYFYNENEYEIAKRDFFVLPNTIKEKDFADIKQFNSNTKIKLFMLGRMDYDGYLQKGFEDFLNALILLDKSYIDKIEIIIVGSGSYRDRLISKSENNNLPIKFIEKLSHEETLGAMSQSDVVVLPSRFEGMSMFGLEALYTKNLVIFTNTGGIKDMVTNNGFLVDVQNIEQLSYAIERVVELDLIQREEMKNNSSFIYNSRYKSNVIKSKFMQILKMVK